MRGSAPNPGYLAAKCRGLRDTATIRMPRRNVSSAAHSTSSNHTPNQPVAPVTRIDAPASWRSLGSMVSRTWRKSAPSRPDRELAKATSWFFIGSMCSVVQQNAGLLRNGAQCSMDFTARIESRDNDRDAGEFANLLRWQNLHAADRLPVQVRIAIEYREHLGA